MAICVEVGGMYVNKIMLFIALNYEDPLHYALAALAHSHVSHSKSREGSWNGIPSLEYLSIKFF